MLSFFDIKIKCDYVYVKSHIKGVQRFMTNKNKYRSSKVLTILLTIFCLALCLSFAELFSSLITTSGLSAVKDGEVKQSAFNLYAICLYQTDTQTLATENATLAKRQGGAGYIWQGDKFYVLASCYENEEDAKKVQQNLQENDTTCEIIKLSFDALSISTTSTGQEKNILTESVQCYKNLYKQLYDLSVSIDTELLTDIQAKVSLSDITSNFKRTKSNFSALFNSQLTASILELKLSLESVEVILDELADYSSTETPYTSVVKYAYFEILSEYAELTDAIQ